MERIRLDTAALATAQRLRTEEFWPDRAEPVVYMPQCHYQRSDGGRHELHLTYREKDHPPALAKDVIWGRSTIVLNKDLSAGTAHWTTVPADTRYDGSAKVKVRREAATAAREREAVSRVKRRQAAFKAELLRRGTGCDILGTTPRAALDAVHVQDVEDGGPDIPENGLLLRADLHRLFDAGLLQIRPDGRIQVARSLPKDYKDLLRGRRLSADTLSRIAHHLQLRRTR